MRVLGRGSSAVARAEGGRAAPGRDDEGRAPDDLGPILHEEIGRLPERYRVAVVLCDLQGLTHHEAACRLRWPIGTVKSRQSRGRERLRARLVRRGFAPSVGVFAAWISAERASATVPTALLEATARMGFRVAKGPLAAGMVPAAVLSLETQAGHAMWMLKFKVAAALVLTAGIAVGGVAAVAQQAKSPRPAEAQAEGRVPSAPGANQVNPPVAAVEEGSKPEESKDLAEKLDGARIDLELLESDVDVLKTMLIEAQKKLMLQTFAELPERTDATRQARKHNLDDMQRQVLEIRDGYMRKGAELRLARARKAEAEADKRAGVKLPATPPGREGQGSPGVETRMEAMERKLDRLLAATEKAERARPAPRAAKSPEIEAKERAIRKKLDVTIAFPFENETPFEDILKYVMQATAGPNESGIPVYVDPLGLAQAGATMQSPVKLNLEGIPLQISLRLLLRQLKLEFAVKDGLLLISKEGSDFLKAD